MQLIEAALAFAITMLALSLVVSSFVEIIHRIFSMREAGLKYVLGQMFDQVLRKYLDDAEILKLVNRSRPANQRLTNLTAEALKTFRDGFAERMSANRAPMGVTPRATPAAPPASLPETESTIWLKWLKFRAWLLDGPYLSKIEPALSTVESLLSKAWSLLRKIGPLLPGVRLWNGRDLAAMTPAEFMERLGSMEYVGQAIAEVNTEANEKAQQAAQKAGAAAADAVNVALKDVAQKFEAFGKEASGYFEGRARLLSVAVAIVLAYLAHVDAVDLFRTYLRDPNARAKVIEQAGAVTAQYKAAKDAAEAVKKIVPDANAAPPEVKAQVEKIRQEWTEAIGKVDETVKQYADLGVPLGWNPERLARADMFAWVWTCKDPNKSNGEGLGSLWKDCAKNQWQKEAQLFRVPGVLSVWFYLFLGGLLVGLGAPFWYSAVTGLTNLRNSARGTTSADAQTRAGALVAVGAGTVQPVTPVDAFLVSSGAPR
jgi:hypothetical protein